MIYLEFLEGQGLGNQLWNYVTLRSLSKVLGFEYKVLHPERFKGKNFLDISYSNTKTFKLYKDEFLISNVFNEKLYYDNHLNALISDFDNQVLSIETNTTIRGLFQSERYLFNNDINEFIKVKSIHKEKIRARKNKCLLNIRGREYKRFKKLILPKSYWLNAMRNMKSYNNNLTFAIITDDYDYASKLLPEIEIIKGDSQEDFFNILFADYLIVSNSSFSYFPINLGEKPKKIIAPAHWARFGNSEEIWISPSNYYKNWSYQNKEGKIISKIIAEESIKKTMSIYSKYYILTSKESLKRKTIFSFFPKSLRKNLKKFLSRFLPLHIG